jgi:hypothetical protein
METWMLGLFGLMARSEYESTWELKRRTGENVINKRILVNEEVV